jgi:hypothetical protein
MSCHYLKLTNVFMEVISDISESFEGEIKFDLLEHFNQTCKPMYKFLDKLQKRKNGVNYTLPAVVIGATMGATGLTIKESKEYVDSLELLPHVLKAMLHDFIHLFATNMLSAFLVIDGRVVTREARFTNVSCGKFVIKSITVNLISDESQLL